MKHVVPLLLIYFTYVVECSYLHNIEGHAIKKYKQYSDTYRAVQIKIETPVIFSGTISKSRPKKA